MPIGMATAAEMRSADSAMVFDCVYFPCTTAAAMAGTMLIVIGVTKAAGRLYSVCTLP